MDLSDDLIDSIGGPLTIGEKKESIGEQEHCNGERENFIDEENNSIGEKKDSLGERENFIGEPENSSVDKKNSLGERDNSNGEVHDEKDSLGERESFVGEVENSIDEQKNSLGDKKDSPGERETFIGEVEDSIGERENSRGEVQDSTGGRGNSIDESGSLGERQSFIGERESSNGEVHDEKESLGERENIIGEVENSIDEQKNSLGDKKDSPGERENFIGEVEDSIGERENYKGEEQDSTGGRRNSIDENGSLGERQSFIGERESSNGEVHDEKDSLGERENFIGEENNSIGERESFSGEVEDSLGEREEPQVPQEPQHVAGAHESVAELCDELAYLQFTQKQLLENEQNKDTFIDSLAEDWDLNPTIRRTFAKFEALVAANPIVETGLKPHFLQLVKRANPVSTQCPRMLERATLIRNNLIMAALFADVRAARLQDQLMKPSGLQSPEEVLQAIGILPAEPSTSSTSMANDLADAVRFRCLKMLTSALKVASLPEDCAACKPEEMAAQLEAAIYAGFNKTNKKYKKRIQSRVAQLKDVRNQEVLCKYMSGAISAKQLAKMTPKEMASHMMTSNEKNSNPEAD